MQSDWVADSKVKQNFKMCFVITIKSLMPSKFKSKVIV